LKSGVMGVFLSLFYIESKSAENKNLPG